MQSFGMGNDSNVPRPSGTAMPQSGLVVPASVKVATCCIQPLRLTSLTNLMVAATDQYGIVSQVRVSSVCVNATCLTLLKPIGYKLHSNDEAEMRDFYRRVEFMRSNIGAVVDGAAEAQMPKPWDLFFLGRAQTVKGRSLFCDYADVYTAQGIPGLRDRLCDIYDMKLSETKIIPSPISQPIKISSNYLRHLPELRPNGAGFDEDHMLYAPLTPSTVTDPDEIFYGELKNRATGTSRSLYTFLRTYMVESADRQVDVVYHLVLAYPDGVLRTGHRLKGGATAFIGKRRGKLLYAAYL